MSDNNKINKIIDVITIDSDDEEENIKSIEKKDNNNNLFPIKRKFDNYINPINFKHRTIKK